MRRWPRRWHSFLVFPDDDNHPRHGVKVPSPVSQMRRCSPLHGGEQQAERDNRIIQGHKAASQQSPASPHASSSGDLLFPVSGQVTVGESEGLGWDQDSLSAPGGVSVWTAEPGEGDVWSFPSSSRPAFSASLNHVGGRDKQVEMEVGMVRGLNQNHKTEWRGQKGNQGLAWSLWPAIVWIFESSPEIPLTLSIFVGEIFFSPRFLSLTQKTFICLPASLHTQGSLPHMGLPAMAILCCAPLKLHPALEHQIPYGSSQPRRRAQGARKAAEVRSPFHLLAAEHPSSLCSQGTIVSLLQGAV